MLISISQINKSFGETPILRNITMTIEDHVRYGLVGVNGAGKSTLLNILIGELEADSGEVYRSSQLSLGYLKQNAGLERNCTIREEMWKVFDDVRKVEADMRKLEKEMAEISNHESAEYQRITKEYAKKQGYLDSRDGYQIDVKIKMILNGMGFQDKDMDTLIHTLSGGEKTRLAMARLLLEEPNLLILDEPTNHLDFKTLNWLEGYLATYNGSVLVVSHDRYFLDKLTQQIFELERGVLYSYKGNYTAYLKQRQERILRQSKEYEEQQIEIAKLQTYVDKNIVRASTSGSAKSRLKTLENMQVIEKPEGEIRPIHLRFETTKKSYKDVLTVEELELAVGEERRILCSHINLAVKRGEKIAIIGENGVGKSTFLKTVQGFLPKHSGTYVWGNNTSIGYYEQENLNLNPKRLAIDELWDRFPHIPEAQIRRVLGNVRLTKEDVYKTVEVISGGERAKLAFCILMLEKDNVLLVDEPTNHLDLPSKEVLEQALDQYDGTLLFITHDRYLLNKIPDKIIEMTKDGIAVYEGNYDAYMERLQFLCAKEREQAPSTVPKNTGAGSYKSKEQRRAEAQRRSRIRELEEQITWLEKEIGVLQDDLTREEVYTDYQLGAEKTRKLEENAKALDACYEEWEQLQDEEE